MYNAALWQLHYVQYELVVEPTMVVSTWSMVMAYFWCVAALWQLHYVHFDIAPNPLRQQVRPT